MKKASKKPVKRAPRKGPPQQRPLSPQRERFCQEVAKSGNQSEAYRVAFPSSKAWTDKILWSHASQLMRDGKVKVRVAQLRRETETRLGMSRQRWLEKWVVLAGKGQPGDRMRALENIGKALGYYAPEQHEVLVAGTVVHVDLSDRLAVLELEIAKAFEEALERKRAAEAIAPVDVKLIEGEKDNA